MSPLPTQEKNQYASYCVGIGGSNFLELHELRGLEVLGLGETNWKQGDLVALKRYLQSDGDDLDNVSERKFDSIERELQVFCHPKLKNHENICKLIAIGWEDHTVSPTLVLELAQYGTLQDLLRYEDLDEHPNMDVHIALDIASGVEALHSSGIVHGDIKPANILMFKHPERHVVAKIADFTDSFFVQDLIGRPWMRLGGTHAWRAPECFGDSRYDLMKADVYSFGLCCLAVLARGSMNSPGRKGDCFLSRNPDHSHLSIERQQKMLIHEKIKSGPGFVIYLANKWINQHAVDSSTRKIASELAMATLHQRQEKRFDINSARQLICRHVDGFRHGTRFYSSDLDSDLQALEAIPDAVYPETEDQVALLQDLNMINLSDARFDLRDSFFKRRCFAALEDIAQPALNFEFPDINEDCIEHAELNYDALFQAVLLSVSCPPQRDFSEFQVKRAYTAAYMVALCYMNEFGTVQSNAKALQWLAIAGRCNIANALLYFLALRQTCEFTPASIHNVPQRLWLVWASAHGSRESRAILQREDPELHQKMLRLVSSRGYLLRHSKDPTQLMLHIRNKIQQERLNINHNFNPLGFTYLHYAVAAGDLGLVKEIVEQGHANVNVISWTQESAVSLAATNDHFEIARYLLDHGASDSRPISGQTNALHQLAYIEDKTAARLAEDIVHTGAQLSLLSSEKHYSLFNNPRLVLRGTPVQWASRANKAELFSTLLNLHERYGVLLPDWRDILIHVTSHYQAGILAELIHRIRHLRESKRALSPEELDRLLFISAGSDRRPHLILLHGISPLTAQLQTIDVLLKVGAQPYRVSNATSSPTIPEGSNNANTFLSTEDVRHPQTSIGSPDAVLRNNLHEFCLSKAISCDAVEVFRKFIDWGRANNLDVEALLKDTSVFEGRDAVQRSIYSQSFKVFSYLMDLMDEGIVDLDYVSDRGMTALHAAATRDDPRFVHELIRRGCSPHTRSKDGRTPFISALYFKNFPIAKALVESDACDKQRLFFEPNNNGFTLFGTVISSALTNYRHVIGTKTIKFLEDIGAVTHISNVFNQTTILETIAVLWPTTRPDYINFETWLLEFVLEHTPPEYVNKHDDMGLSALHWMVARSNYSGVSIMLRHSAVNNQILTAPPLGSSIPPSKSALDMAVDRLQAMQENIPEHVRRGGEREIRFWMQRVEDIVGLLHSARVTFSGGTSGSETIALEEVGNRYSFDAYERIVAEQLPSANWTERQWPRALTPPTALPKGWSLGKTDAGRVFFVDHANRKTTWTDPRTRDGLHEVDAGRKRLLSKIFRRKRETSAFEPLACGTGPL